MPAATKPLRDPFAQPFSFSYSKLKNYETCPTRHLHYDLLRDVKDDGDSQALLWGNALHEAMAKAIGNDIKNNASRLPRDRIYTRPLPMELRAFQGWVEKVQDYRDADRTVIVEANYAVDREFNKAPWFGDSTWLRVKADVVVLDQRKIVGKLMDWKTGRRKADMPQLMLSAIVLFAHYPTLRALTTEYVWLSGDHPAVNETPVDSATYRREELPAMWNELSQRVAELERAFKERNYPPSPSGLCRAYCAVHMCPHYGVGG